MCFNTIVKIDVAASKCSSATNSQSINRVEPNIRKRWIDAFSESSNIAFREDLSRDVFKSEGM